MLVNISGEFAVGTVHIVAEVDVTIGTHPIRIASATGVRRAKPSVIGLAVILLLVLVE